MNFQVNPDSVASYGSLVERNGVNLSLVNVHLAQHGNLGSTGGVLLSMLAGAHEATVSRMSDDIYRGFHVMGDSGSELRNVADYYRTTDQGSATRLDGTYPGSPRPAVEVPPNPGGISGPVAGGRGQDVRDPTSHLRPPEQPEEFTDPLKFFNVVDDLLSPSAWISQVLDDTIGFNPVEHTVDFIFGDWEGFARCGLVWEDMSEAVDAIGENVASGLRWLSADWQGNAADAAVHYFDYMRRALFSHRDVLHQLHDKYLEVARGIWNVARAAADLLKQILDKAIMAAVAVAAGWLTSWTGVGTAISWGFAAYECYRIMGLWGDVTRLLSRAQAAIEIFVGFLQSMDAATLDEIKPVAMPAVDYEHPNPEVRAQVAEDRTRGGQRP